MFTGLVQGIGRLLRLEQQGADAVLHIAAGTLSLDDVALGDSIAVNGVCLTVTTLTNDSFTADASAETLALTTLGHYRSGQRLNLEKAVTPTTRLGGHLVSGHVDGIGTITERRLVARAHEFWVSAPPELARYIAVKGSITVDGVSLTVNEVNQSQFRLTIIPHTAHQTTLETLTQGGSVNLEVDVIARYLERLMTAPTDTGSANGLTVEQLAQAGFIK